MATPIQQPPAPTQQPVQARQHADRATDQYLACMAAAGHFGPLEEYCRQLVNSNGAAVHARYYLALALARANKTDEALASLRTVIAIHNDHADARRIAYRLLIHAARAKAQAQDWDELTKIVAEALSLAPPDANPAQELAAFRHALPLGHLRSGNRKEAALLWEHQLRVNPRDHNVIHNLALLYYWWARRISDEGDPASAGSQWRAAISYWAILAQSETFWEEWAAARSGAWGFDFPAADVEVVRNGIVGEKLIRYFQEHADDHAQKQRTAAARVYEDFLTASALEAKSAGLWRQALTLLPPDPSRPAILTLPLGYLFAERNRLLRYITATAEKLAAGKQHLDVAALLQICFSEHGLGTAFILAEERNKPDDAIALLDLAPQPVRISGAARYVRALAYTRKGTNFLGQGKTAAALRDWRLAYDSTIAADHDHVAPLLAGLRITICEHSVTAAKKEASRLKKERGLDMAIAMLESARVLDHEDAILELLCVYLCDRAGEHLRKKSYPSAREQLNKALNLRKNYSRAIQLLSTVYNNEACDEEDGDRKIALFEKSLELSEGDYQVKENLAGVLKGKAIKRWNALQGEQIRYGCDEVVRLLERAANLFEGELVKGALGIIEARARMNVEAAKKSIQSVENDLLKRILTDLAVVYNARYQVRGY